MLYRELARRRPAIYTEVTASGVYMNQALDKLSDEAPPYSTYVTALQNPFFDYGPASYRFGLLPE